MKPITLLLQGSARREINYVKINVVQASPTISGIVCDADVIVKSVFNGEKITRTYPAGTTSISVESDPNTDVYFYGGIVSVSISSNSPYYNEIIIKSDHITSFVTNGSGSVGSVKFDCSGSKNLTTLALGGLVFNSVNVSGCVALTSMTIAYVYTDSIAGLLSCVSLQSVKIANSQVKTVDLHDLANLTTVETPYCGELEELNINGCAGLDKINVDSCSKLKTLNVYASSALTSLNIAGCVLLPDVDYSRLTGITQLVIRQLPNLRVLDLTPLTQLSDFTLVDMLSLEKLIVLSDITNGFRNSCPAVNYIAVRANNSSFSDQIKGIISAASTTDGVVYLNSQDTYYSTIANAATTKGWTIEPLA